MKAANLHRRNDRFRLNLPRTTMSDTSRPRILIVTAAFGEGHNSAARNLGLALEAAGAEVKIGDPCMLGVPRLTRILNSGYRMVTTRFPKIWAWIYRSTDRCDFSEKKSRVMRWIEQAMAQLVREFKPDAVVSTYPLYPYFMPRIDLSIPVFTVVTDSMEINAAWLRSPSNQWLVTDDTTRETMMGAGLDSHKLAVTGFQVHPKFAHMQTLGPDVDCSKFRILYFPTAKVAHMTKQAHALLDKVPSVYLTIVMGKNVRRLYRAAKKIKAAYPGRVRLIGWTTRIPEYFGTHHLAVGKAGGATVHEAIAARCPMLIPHLVPGQEEGNLRLLEAIGGGALADTPSELRRHLSEMLANNAATWREMKHAMAKGGRNSGALIAAYLILSRINQPKPKS